MSIRYITKRQLLIKRQELLCEQIAQIETAIGDLIDGRITNYSIGSFSAGRTPADIDKLHSLLNELRTEFLENDNVLRGRSRRVVEHQYYQNPTNIRYF